MARLITSGGEIRDHSTSNIGSPDGYSGGAAATTTETTVVRSGSAAFKCAGTSANSSYRIFPFTAPAAGTSLFAREYMRFSALPSATKVVARFSAGATNILSARLTSAGKLQLWNDVAGTQVGSDSTDTFAVDTWYRVALMLKIGSGSTDAAELRYALPDSQAPDYPTTTVASTSAVSITDTQPTELRLGWVDAPGVTSNMFLDDIGVNDSTGTKQTSWLGEGQVALCKANRVVNTNSTWTDCRGTLMTDATSLPALKNTPPTGEADTTAHSTPHQARCTSSSSTSMGVALDSFNASGLSGDVVSTGTISGGDQNFGGSNLTFLASSFFMSGSIDYIDVRFKKVGSPTDAVTLEIRTDSSVKPSNTVLASTTIDSSVISTSYAYYRWRLDVPMPVTAGARYWLVMSRTVPAGSPNWYAWERVTPAAGADRVSTTATTGNNDWATVDTTASPQFHVFASEGFGYVAALQIFCCHGEAVSTGTKTGLLQSVRGPVVSGLSFNYGDDVGAAGTYPSNWRWKSVAVSEPVIVSADDGPQLQIGKSDGTNRVANLCFAGAYFEYRNPPSDGWVEYVKTADSTHWWAKRVSVETTFQWDTMGTQETVVAPGDYALHADPLPASGADMGTVTSVDQATLDASYTKV